MREIPGNQAILVHAQKRVLSQATTMPALLKLWVGQQSTSGQLACKLRRCVEVDGLKTQSLGGGNVGG
jgi:hypothetical protein